MKKEDLEKYHLLKNKKKMSTNEFFLFRKLSFEKRKYDFETLVIPHFKDFAKRHGFELTHIFKELSRIFLIKEGLEIFFVEEYQPRKNYSVVFKFLIDKKEKRYNLSSLITGKESGINMEQNCFNEQEILNVLLFITENLFDNKNQSYDIKTIYSKFLKLRIDNRSAIE
ncbi:hypothetical protein [Zobellia barbeyronii]|uniref:Uncharacterized protein n=1 Tax=Zobellia barbeyronii TaxID=2748009 RepID=A0ABS5W9D4_9FLAO|nr:hypothetical protein [Zobellia barbeyronii]MBT2160028.1 hypothetical protein [Zobellia barbeyronii]